MAKQVQLDSFSIIPGTLRFANLPDSLWTLDPVHGILEFVEPSTDSVWVQYRVFKTRLDMKLQRMRFDSIMNNTATQAFVFNRQGVNSSAGMFDFGTINYNGSFGRGLSFGNAQSVVVNSQLNLQITGMLLDSIEVAAAITDNNIPIQPDGTTQQLNEFDKILLQFRKKNWEVSLGDIDIRTNESYFLNFYKRLQGVSFSTENRIGQNINNKALVGGAIAKGKFTRNLIQSLEGNQGPYRLEGANGELFFIVLAGTERVFIDGELLQRGEDQDYVINYNTAEITFTPKRMINRDRRIQVEFEYADRNYLNSLFYVSDEMQFGEKLSVRLSAYDNSDAKSSPINQQLTTGQKQFLNGLGDNIDNAFAPTAIFDTAFGPTKILYAKLDTFINGLPTSVYVYSINRDSAKYALVFSDLGYGNGDYVELFNAANGKVYKYIAPDQFGVKQGRYSPVTKLITPKKQQMFSLGTTYQMNANTQLKTEVAMSVWDVNTFSDRDKGNDQGYAAKFLFENKLPINLFHKALSVKTNLGYEYVSATFKPLERLRAVEFSRDWGLAVQSISTLVQEQLPTASISLIDEKNNSIAYQFSGYLRGDNFNAFRQSLTHVHDINGWKLNNNFTFTFNNTPFSNGYFLRPTIDISKRMPKLGNYTIGASYSLEHSANTIKQFDTLSPLSFSFDIVKAYLKSPENPNNWQLTYYTRTDRLPIAKQFTQASKSQNLNLQVELFQNKKHQFRSSITYRQLEVNAAYSFEPAEQSLLSRSEYFINEMKGFITGSVLYETGAGQEQKKDFSFLEVPAGQGEYTWRDYNNDSIPQINEFEIALFRDQAKYIRIFTPTRQYVKAAYTQFNYSVQLNPRNLFPQPKNNLQKFVSRINLQSSLQISKKEIAKDQLLFNPFKGALSDTTLIVLNSTFANTVSYNRYSTVWGVDVSNITNNNKALLTYGLESRQLIDWNVRVRYNVTRQFTLDITSRTGNNELSTPSFANRNYKINQFSSEPRITYTRNSNFRVALSYKLDDKKNAILFGGENSFIQSLNVESRYNAFNNASINAKFTFSSIDYKKLGVGNIDYNTPVAFILLDGLLPGKNYLWNIEFTKRLGNNLELNFQYEGRQPSEGNTVHVGRASLRALF
jgi:hypothetical protein